MAFVCILESRRCHIEVARNGGSYIASTTVGYDDASDTDYITRVTLDVLPGGVDYDLTFCLSSYDGRTEHINDIFSGREVAQIIPRPDRALILAHLVTMIEDLLRTVRPSQVSMFTIERDLPRAALRKYWIIEQAFVACGYKVHRRPDHRGQKIWWMELTGPATI